MSFSIPVFPERCQQEIDTVLEGKVQPSFEDRHQMPYTQVYCFTSSRCIILQRSSIIREAFVFVMQAVIHELQRVANTVPLAVFHQTTKDTDLLGYSIPRVQCK